MSRVRRLALAAGLGVGLSFGALATFFLATEQGLQLLWRLAAGWLPAELAIDHVTGRIIGPLDIRGLRYEDETLRLELDHARLDWVPARLLRGTLWLERIAVRGLNYSGLQSAPEKRDGFTLPESMGLPLRIVLVELSLQEAAYSPAPESEPLRLDHARLAAEAGARQWSVSRLELYSPRLDLQGDLQLQVEQEYAMTGRLQWQLRPTGYPAVDGHTEIKGNLRELLVTQTLASPYNSRAKLSLEDPIDALRFSARLNLTQIALQTFDADLPPLTMEGEITASGDLTENRITANLQIFDPNLGQLQAVVAAGVDTETLLIDSLRLTLGDQSGTIDTKGKILIGEQQPKLALQTTWQDLRWPLQGRSKVHSSQGTVEINGTVDQLSAEFDASILQQGRVRGSLERRHGQVEISLRWQDLIWPEQQPMVISSEGGMELSGNMEDYRFDLDAALEAPGTTSGVVQLQGNGDMASAQFGSILVTALEGQIQGDGHLTWQPRLKGRLSLAGKGVNPGALFAEWPGDLAFTLKSEGELRGKQWLARADRLDIKGNLRGYPVRLSASGELDEQGIRLNRASLASGQTTLSASGQIGESLDLQWQIRSDDLASLLPGAAGRLRGRGMARGKAEVPLLEMELLAEDAKYAAYSLKDLRLEADLDLSGGRDSRLLLEATEGSLETIKVERLKLTGSGNPGSHNLQLDAVTSRGDTELSIDGGLQADRWQFRLAAAQLRYPGLAAWTLRSPSNGWLTKDAAGFSLSKHCWSSEQALLCLGGSRSLKGWQGEFDLQDLPLSYFAHWLPATVKSQGKLNGQGQVRQPASIGEMQASLRLETTAGALLSATEDGDWIPVLAFQPGRGSFDLKRQSMELAIVLPFESGGGIEMEARLPAAAQPLLERPLSGALTVQAPDITVIRDLLEDIEQVEGRLEGKATLAGTLAAPRFRGKLALMDGAVELSRPGISLNDVQIALSGQERGEIDISATASSGPGRVQVKGNAWVTADGLSSDLRLTGENFQLVDLPEARVQISPAMNLALSGDRISVQGEVKVPSARIKLKSLPESSVRVSPDQVIVQGQDDETTAPADTRRIDASLRLILGENVRFEGLGLKAKLAGNLLLTEQPGQLTTASGSINLTEGTYKAYGQNLTIERGRLLYAGGLVTEPGLDVRAVRRPAAGVEVGVEAQGSLRNPRFSLFSEPAMSQSEQLSYLVLGRPLEGGTSSEEGNAMNRAALALGLAGGEFVAEQFGEKLGVDSIGIESGTNEATEEASLVVGKYLSPKLYVGYGVGLFDPVSTIRMSYSISSNWKLVTETSSEASGADLYYTIDRGQ